MLDIYWTLLSRLQECRKINELQIVPMHVVFANLFEEIRENEIFLLLLYWWCNRSLIGLKRLISKDFFSNKDQKNSVCLFSHWRDRHIPLTNNRSFGEKKKVLLCQELVMLTVCWQERISLRSIRSTRTVHFRLLSEWKVLIELMTR